MSTAQPIASKNTRLRALALVAIGLGLLADGNAAPATPAKPLAIKTCEGLQGMRIAASSIGLPSGGALLESATRAAAVAPYADDEGEHLLTTPERCLVLGSIASIDPAAPAIKFAINLPLSNWNHRALQSGGGGMGGAVITAPGQKASGRFDPMPIDAPYPISLGYVTFGSNGGHASGDFAFTKSDEAMRNWAYEHLKKTRDVAVEVIKLAYKEAPRKVFFSGESAGGREALVMAQKYPNDYDGIIATSPVIQWNAIHLYDNRRRDRLMTGFLNAADIKLVADRTRASCDLADGVADGVIAKYLECTNDVATLRCADGKAGSGCLSDAQIASVNALREPADLGVTLANNISRFPGFGVTGDEDGTGFQWPFYPIGTVAPSMVLPAGMGFEPGRGVILSFGAFWVRHAVVGDETFNPAGFNPAPYAGRLQYLSRLFDATNPDLTAFSARGGRLLIIHPSADNAAPLTMSGQYYRSVVATMGKAAADRTMRLYVGPGGSHNVGGVTQIDALTLLEKWVLQGETPPDAPVAYFKNIGDASLVRAMPACRYPAYAKYVGGDIKLSTSYTCTPRADPLN
ncbi:tannase/feruloyl esterase family alpha/beta hydrolase [Telluria mixta]|uniref:Tannase/feruloyl esterase family alpha/beta hydrolase n=1 Tax=Telluria mixta TaxID=34071 RepID=A0ABT2BRZ7_9BURK|nr:tannase/feruloyl esterase family alpha/beta hydrolase [Telluria mixta]MCS0627892.1 tannase/feruloyl esterase family alpha/beta hydrolase [Telluria mixta]WEM93989.1 tannase/feruloyl esterase family alpha/beta hydrolase [Telluria mixta]